MNRWLIALLNLVKDWGKKVGAHWQEKGTLYKPGLVWAGPNLASKREKPFSLGLYFEKTLRPFDKKWSYFLKGIYRDLFRIYDLLIEWWQPRPDKETVAGELSAKAVWQAHRDWLAAKNYFEQVVEPDLVDQAIYHLEAAEKRFVYLLKKMKLEHDHSKSNQIPLMEE